MLEKKIEAAVCAYGNLKGVTHYKFTSPSRRSVPDQLFHIPSRLPGGFTFYIEFKRTGEKATDSQAREHVRLRALGFDVFVCDDVQQGKDIIDAMLAKCARFNPPEFFKVN